MNEKRTESANRVKSEQTTANVRLDTQTRSGRERHNFIYNFYYEWKTKVCVCVYIEGVSSVKIEKANITSFVWRKEEKTVRTRTQHLILLAFFASISSVPSPQREKKYCFNLDECASLLWLGASFFPTQKSSKERFLYRIVRAKHVIRCDRDFKINELKVYCNQYWISG